MGRQSQAQGAVFEDFLTRYHQILNANQKAMVWQHGTRAKILPGETEEGEKKVTLQKSLPDFGACLTGIDSMSAAFDAKHIKQPRYAHPKKKLHQSDFLYRLDAAGGIAFILVWITGLESGDQGWILWPQDRWQEYHNKSWSIDLSKSWPLSVAFPVPAWKRIDSYFPDWYRVVEAVEDPQFRTLEETYQHLFD